jgi:hypothetical protein
MEMHNSFEKQDSIHRDAICSTTLSGYTPGLQNTVPFDSKRVAMCLRRKRAEVTNFSTWGGSEYDIGELFRTLLTNVLCDVVVVAGPVCMDCLPDMSGRSLELGATSNGNCALRTRKLCIE